MKSREFWPFVGRAVAINGEQQDLIPVVEARLNLPQLLQAAHKQPGADQQQEGERNLRDDESFAESQTCLASAEIVRLIFQVGVQINSCRPPGRRETEQDSGQQRDSGGETQDARIRAELER